MICNAPEAGGRVYQIDLWMIGEQESRKLLSRRVARV